MDQSFIQNPYPIYEELAKQGDIFWDQNHRSWCVTGYDLACEVLTDSHYSSNIGYFLTATTFPVKSRQNVKPLVDMIEQWLFYLDPPQHTVLRKKLGPEFSSKSMLKYSPDIKAITEEVCQQQSGEFDFVANVSEVITSQIMSVILDIPKEEAPRLVRWTLDVVGFLDAFVRTKYEYKPALQAAHEMHEYFGDDWALKSMLVGTGIETSMSFLSSVIYTLLQNPEQFDFLKKNPEHIDRAIDELFRFEPPVHLNVRSSKIDREIQGCDIKAGDVVSIFLAAANRDQRIYSNPHQFNIMRKHRKNLSFGHGIHYCLGRFLARLTARHCIEYILEQWPHIKLAEQEIEWTMGTSLRRLKSLRVKID
jgi:cytochrome P450